MGFHKLRLQCFIFLLLVILVSFVSNATSIDGRFLIKPPVDTRDFLGITTIENSVVENGDIAFMFVNYAPIFGFSGVHGSMISYATEFPSRGSLLYDHAVVSNKFDLREDQGFWLFYFFEERFKTDLGVNANQVPLGSEYCDKDPALCKTPPLPFEYTKDFSEEACLTDPDSDWIGDYTADEILKGTIVLKITADTVDYDLYQAIVDELGSNPTSSIDVLLIVNPAIVVRSSSFSEGAIYGSRTLPSGSTVTIINKGVIQGLNGLGGVPTSLAGGDGGKGGPAISLIAKTDVYNEGIIFAGGGGGGAGGNGQYAKNSRGGPGGYGAGSMDEEYVVGIGDDGSLSSNCKENRRWPRSNKYHQSSLGGKGGSVVPGLAGTDGDNGGKANSNCDNRQRTINSGGKGGDAGDLVNSKGYNICFDGIIKNELVRGEVTSAVKIGGCYIDIKSVSSQNYCCGNDPWEDVGTFTIKNGEANLCVLEPNGNFKWITPDSESLESNYVSLERGNQYEIFDSLYYREEHQNILGDTGRMAVPSTHTYDIMSDGENWHVCTELTSPKGVIEELNSFIGSEIIIHHPANGDRILVGEDTGYLHEYLCDYDFGRASFSECSGDSTPYNDYDYTGSGYLWKSESFGLGEGPGQLYTFEDVGVPKYLEPEFNSVGTTPFKVDYTSSKRLYGVRSLKLSYVNEGTSFNSVGFARSDLYRTDFSNSLLEGYIMFDSSTALDLVLSDENGEIAKFSLDEYVVGDVNLGEWEFFSIPVNFPFVKSIGFEVDTGLYNHLENGKYDFYIDNIGLTSFSDNAFCGRDLYELNGRQLPTYNWYDDRDDNKFSCAGNGLFNFMGDDLGCCGDAQGENIVGPNGVCMDSNFIPVGERFGVVSFGISSDKNSDVITQTYFCSDEESECRYALPRLGDAGLNELYLHNMNPDKFDIYFESTRNASSLSSNDFIVVKVKNFEYLSMDENIVYCGADFGEVPSSISQFTTSNFEKGTDSGCSLASHFLCSFDEGWTTTLNAEPRDAVDIKGETNLGGGGFPLAFEFDQLKSVPSSFEGDVSIPQSCCPSDYCWDGKICVEDQINEPDADWSFLIDENNGYRCVEGEWKESSSKVAPLGSSEGFCPIESQCFVSSKGAFSQNGNVLGNPQCVNDTQFVGDYYCEEGDWTSRTKVVAEYLLDTLPTSKQISLYCDNFNNVFNYADNILLGKSIRDVVQDINSCKTNASGFGLQPCMNNFCVLETPKGISFGTSLNVELDSASLNLTKLFGIDSVSDCIDEGELARCYSSTVDGKKMNWYYDSTSGVLINSEYSLNTHLNWFERFANGVKSIFGKAISEDIEFDYGELGQNLDLRYLNSDQRFDVIYYMRSGNERVTAINGNINDLKRQTSSPYVGVKYESFGFLNGNKDRDICSYIESYDQAKSPLFDLVCSESSESNKPYYVFALGEEGTSINIWNDLTSKLRLME